MTFAEKAFACLARARQDNGGTIGREQWVKIVDGLFEVERPSPVVKKKKTSQLTDEEWLVSLEQEPCLAGVDIRAQLALAHFWCKQHARICTRKFFGNWVLNAEKKIILPGGKQVMISKDVYKEPEGWRHSDFARRAMKLSEDSWSVLTARDWLDLSTDIRATILRAL